MIVIRPVDLGEHPQVAELLVRAYGAVPGFDLHPDYEPTLRDVAARTVDSVVLVAEVDGALVGSVTYVPGRGRDFEFDLDDTASMRMLGVVPEASGRGVGTALVRSCIDAAHAAGRLRIALHTERAMRGAQHMYASLGFRRMPGLDWEPLPGVDLLAYVLDLPPTT
jgi:ribosomal protein S18 acetylase RimI-like enzyme